LIVTEKLYLEIRRGIIELEKVIEALGLAVIIKERLRKKADYALFFLDKGLKLLSAEG